MAIYFLNIKTFGRSGGSSAVSAAAYRSGERIQDERTGKIYDHSQRQDVMHKEIVLPSKFADDDIAWAKERANLWNLAESTETRKNARVAREYLVALPVELSPQQRLGLVKGFSQELSDRYGFAVDVAIHAPREFPGSDPRNFHAHLLTTTREVTIEGLGAKTTLELNDNIRHARGLGPAINELLHVRSRWATVANEAMREAQIGERIDHRSLDAQGIDREPRPHIPRAAFEMERHGYRSAVADAVRENYQARLLARVQAALAKAAEHNQSATPHPKAAASGAGATPGRAADMVAAAKPRSTEEIRREARENWLRLRQNQLMGRADPAPAVPKERARDDDLSL
jgi:ATP-dependent exoDNAse (exonuclease V) alpha subunit